MSVVADRLDASYKNLREAVEHALTEGVVRAQHAVFGERLRTYWEVGGLLQTHLNAAGIYGDQTVRQLSTDVKISRQVLYDALKFRQLFPIVPAQGLLTWSHYRRLLSIRDPALQERLLSEAEAGSWSLSELNLQIQGANALPDVAHSDSFPPTKLQAKRGEPYVYRTIEKRDRLALDLGFRDSHPIWEAAAEKLSPGQVVRSVPDGRSEGGYRVEGAGLRVKRFAFPATVERIIDGDTIWATLDLGFGTWADRKLRLRGIDTPELKTAGGIRARDYLTRTLEEAGVFVVTTTKIDLYDRYLADLFVLPGTSDPIVIAREGRYVNRELVQKGLARLWTSEKPPEF